MIVDTGPFNIRSFFINFTTPPTLSASKAKEILRGGHRSRYSTLQKHYCKEIKDLIKEILAF